MSKLLFVAALAAVHSLHYTVLASAPADPLITPAPTPTIEKRQVAGGSGTPILSTLHYQYTDLPEQVYPYAVLRGPQSGYNICNSTTLGDTSMCQTLIFNGPDDFCLWGSDVPNGQIGNEEARVVAYCTKPYHGTRLIPPGAITGLQWTKTPGYIQAVGFISNTGLGLDPNDSGGELDPHGADLQGNPLGGVVFSNGTADSDGHTLTQVWNWNTFVGGGQFCFKACYNSITDPDYCENRYDLLGCSYNMPNNAQNNVFEACQGDVQTPVGIYTSNGQTLTYSMPDPLTAPPPYTPNIPASSSCTTYQSNDLFLAASSTSVASTSASVTGSSKPSGSAAASGSGASRSGSGSATASATGSSSGKTSGAHAAITVPLTLLAGVFAVALTPAAVMLI